MGLSYINQPKDPSSNGLAKDTGVGTGIGDATYFGTDEAIPIIPALTCNPTQGLASHQVLNGKCFNAPTVGTQGGKAFPYMNATPYFDNDLALYRTFPIHESQNVQLRVSAFDWLNHSLLEFAGGSYYSVNYNVDYNSKAITPNFNQGSDGRERFRPDDGQVAVTVRPRHRTGREVLLLELPPQRGASLTARLPHSFFEGHSPGA